MKLTASLISLLFIASELIAQNVFNEALKASHEEIAVTKEKAEAGDPYAQLSLADTLLFNFKKADALAWYRRAAEKGLVDAESKLGGLLLFGGCGIPASEAIMANPVEGVRWTYAAATNGNAQAQLNLSKAFENGIGVSTNLIEAYAWLELYSEATPMTGRVMLNQMALALDGDSLRQGQMMAEEFKSGNWPKISPRKIAEGDSRLALEGIVFGGKVALATINGQALAEGESANVLLKNDDLEIKCLQIKRDSVQILIEGESEPRWLYCK